MKILAISDVESRYLWDDFSKEKLKEIDLILSCGDLSPLYLSFLATFFQGPVLYVHGNHDKTYDRNPPEGCDCVEDRLATVKGLRILGLGGSVEYSGGPHQYTESQMIHRIRKLWFRLWRAKGVDIVVTHSPAQGYGDGEDYAHRGFECFLPFLDKYKPRYLIHGHVHLNYGADRPRTLQRGETTIINAYERYILEIPDKV